MENENWFQKTFRESYMSYKILESVFKGSDIRKYSNKSNNYNCLDIRENCCIKVVNAVCNESISTNYNSYLQIPDEKGRFKTMLLFNKYASKKKRKNKGEYDYLNFYYNDYQFDYLLDKLSSIPLKIKIDRDNDKYRISLNKILNPYFNHGEDEKELYSKYYDSNKSKNILDLLINFYEIV